MPIDQILRELRQERSQLDTAIQALEGLTGTTTTTALAKSSRKGSRMSAAARRKISLAQKARWAKARAGKK
jgi:ribosomal protein L5